METFPNVDSLGLMIPTYEPADGLVVITTYYNPCRYRTRKINYELFKASMQRSKIPCFTIECAFGGEPFELPESLDVIRTRSESVLWQKERLLNLGVSWLPKKYRFVAWLDCDILFQNPSWAQETAELLKTFAIVQVFEKCIRLNQKNTADEKPDEVLSFGTIVPKDKKLISCGNYERHGHTGYGWAMHRTIFDELGLYEYALTGSGDHFIAHAAFNEYGACINHALKRNRCQTEHLKEWGKQFFALVEGNLASVRGTILHLWHGSLIHRGYINRMHTLVDLNYNPYTDVLAPTGKPLMWHPDMNKPGLKECFMEHFKSRNEDGTQEEHTLKGETP